MKKIVAIFLSICFLGGCSASETPEVSNNFSESEEEKLIEIPDLQEMRVLEAGHGSTKCSQEEYSSLYEDVEDLLLKRLQVMNSILHSTYGNPNESEAIPNEDGVPYYLLTEKNSLDEVREELTTVYTDDYSENVFTWLLDHLFLEDQGKLYRANADGWTNGLYDGWVIYEINNNGKADYFLLGYEITDYEYGEHPSLAIWKITQTDDGLRICFEATIETY